MKLNCDMGESFGNWQMGSDIKIMPYIDMANIACGFHASDPQTMNATIALAIKSKVAIGAHPGYPDLLGFGRKAMQFSADELTNIVLYQVGALTTMCAAQGTVIKYVKPHGALYHAMMQDITVFIALVQAMHSIKLPLMIMATNNQQAYIKIADQYQVKLLFEAFADRAYANNGSLLARHIKGAVFTDIDSISNQATQLITQQTVTTNSGKKLNIAADTICIHSDSKLASIAAQQISKLLK